MMETWVQSLGQEDPLEKGRAAHSGEFHGQRRLEGYSLWGHKEPSMPDSRFHITPHARVYGGHQSRCCFCLPKGNLTVFLGSVLQEVPPVKDILVYLILNMVALV